MASPTTAGGAAAAAATSSGVAIANEKAEAYVHLLQTAENDDIEKQQQKARLQQQQQQQQQQKPPPRVRSASVRELCCNSECSVTCGNKFAEGLTSIGRILWTGQFMTVFAVLLFIIAWAIFFGGLAWSETYYYEYYCLPNGTIVFGDRNHRINVSDPKLHVGGYQLPLSEEKRCMPDNAIKRYFPMKATHWIPGIIVSASFLCMCAFSFRHVNRNNINVPDGVSPEEMLSYCNCLKGALLICTVMWSAIGFFTAVIYTALLVSFVDIRGDGQAHISVPTLCVLIQCIMLVFSLCVGFLSKWLSYSELVASESHVD